MSKTSSKQAVSVGGALSLMAEVTKALSPVLRDLTQEQAETLRKNPLKLQEAFRKLFTGQENPICLQNSNVVFAINDVRNELSDETRLDVQLDLKGFVFQVFANRVASSQFALTIEACHKDPVTGDALGDPVYSVEFEELFGMLYPENGLVSVERISEFGNLTEEKITEEYVGRNGIIKFVSDSDLLHIGLEVAGRYIEKPLSYQQARLFAPAVKK